MTKVLIIFLVGNTMQYIILNLSHYMEIKSDRYPVVVEQNNCLTRNVNVYIAYILAAWPKIPLQILH